MKSQSWLALWWLTLALLLAGLTPCPALELLLSDSGRNTVWTQQLKPGDSFDVVGADKRPVGGVFNLSSTLGQFLLPMPQDGELSEMSQAEENNLVKEWGELILDRVQIAVMNREPNFEIRLLQNTPTPRNPADTWGENPNSDKFARIAYASIANTMNYLKERDTPVKITAAMADSGAGTFARATDAWSQYATAFRRADLVQGLAGLKETQNVLSQLGAARVRIFVDTLAVQAPPMTIGRLEVNESLLQESPGLTIYKTAPLANDTSRKGSAAWFNMLSGSMPITVTRLPQETSSDGDNFDAGGVIASTTGPGKRGGRGGGITRPPGWPRPPGPQGGPPPGQQPKPGGKPPPGGKSSPPSGANKPFFVSNPTEFRMPLSGWDPENDPPFNTLSIVSLGIVAPNTSLSAMPCDTPSVNSTMGSEQNVATYDQPWQGSYGVIPPASITANNIPISVLRDVVNIGYAPYNNNAEAVQGGWLRTSFIVNQDDGSQIAVYERQGDNGKLDAYAAIAGTRGGVPGEIGKDLYQGATFNLPPIGEMSTAKALMPAQDLQAVVSGLIHDPEVNFKGVIGQSEGAVFAAIVGGRDNVPSYGLNGAALNQSLVGATPQELANISHNNINIFVTDDFVHVPTSLIPGARNLGDTILVVPNMKEELVANIEPLLGNFAYAHMAELPNLLNNPDAPYRLDRISSQPASGGSIQTLNAGSQDRNFSSIVSSYADMTSSKTINNNLTGASKEQLYSQLSQPGMSMKMGLVPGDGLDVCTEQPIRNSWQPPASFTPPSQQMINQNLTFSQPSLPNFTPPSQASFTPPSQPAFNYTQPYQIPNLNQNFQFSLPYQPDVRGVLLQEAAHVEGEPVRGSELGLVFQDAGGVIDLVRLHRLETAMWAAYLSVDGPGISIDPVDPHFNEHHVRHLGLVRGTDLGRVMRETDYLMKRWAIGTSRPEIPGFLNPDEISEKTGHRVLGRLSRFWLLPQGITFKRAGGMLVLDSGRMTVQTEYLEDNPNGEKNPENEKFAEWFTAHYDQIAAKYPIYQELFEYAQLVGLSTYLKEQKMPLLWFLLKNREMILTEKPIDDLPALAKRSSRWYISIFGGVELQANETVRDQSNITEDPSLAKSLGQARAAATSPSSSDRQVVFSDKNTSYSVSQAGSLSLSGTVATGDIVQTDYSHFQEYIETAGTNSWKLVTPGLELIRHYSPELHSLAQFGLGWHLAVPFHLSAGNNVALQPELPPLRLELHNVLSGEMEALQLTRMTNADGERLAYVSTQKNGLVEQVAFASGVWHLQDCLGVNMWFDSDGDLTKLDLRPDKEVPIKLGGKALRKTVPGYSIVYHYTGGGESGKRLDSVEQGETKAEIQWDDSARLARIGAIQVKRSGGGSELIQYHYSVDGQLNSVQTRGGTLEIKYQDNGMRVLASNK